MQRCDIVKHVQELLIRAEELNSTDCFDASFVSWQGDVSRLLSHAIPASRHLVQKFKGIKFAHLPDPRDLSKQLNNFDNGLVEAIALLRKFERQVTGWHYPMLWSRGRIGAMFMTWSLRVPHNFFWGIFGTVFGSIATVLLIYFLMPWVNSPENGSSSDKQAVRDSLKPGIIIKSISNKDIRELKANSDTLTHPGFNSYYTLFFTLENVGSTTARLDSSLTQYTWRNELFTVFLGSNGNIARTNTKASRKFGHFFGRKFI